MVEQQISPFVGASWVVESIASPVYTAGGMLVSSSVLPFVQQAYVMQVRPINPTVGTVLGTVYMAAVIQDHTYPQVTGTVGGTISGTLAPNQYVLMVKALTGSVLPVVEAAAGTLAGIVIDVMERGS